MNINTQFNLSESTPLCQIMGELGSDKGSLNNRQWHNYTKLYYPLFRNVVNDPINIFELGVGTNNPNVPSNMGVNYQPGSSLRGWEIFFKNGKIFGADIDKNILFNTGRIRTYYCDQTNKEVINEMWNHPDLREKFDIIIEDGLHEYDANVIFFENSIHKLKKGGIYIIEDIKNSELGKFMNKINEWKMKYQNLLFRLEILPHYNVADNTVLIVQKFSD